MKKLERHPATQKLFREAAGDFMALRKEHARASELLWLGLLANRRFTELEITLLKDYLSPHDHALINILK